MGRFTLRGLPDTTYRVFALKDNDRNYKYNERSEGLAFDHTDYRTTLRDSVRTDTIRIDSMSDVIHCIGLTRVLPLYLLLSRQYLAEVTLSPS